MLILKSPSLALLPALALALLLPSPAFAHCDGLDGPVVAAAREALRTGDVNLVLVWVQQKGEAEIRKSFERTLAVRKLGPEAKELADTYFFETLVRVHRTGEGAPYTGLKPAGRDLGPAIPAADKALQAGNVEPVVKLLTDAARDGIRDRFKQAVALKSYKKDDLDSGRKYVEAYVTFIHYVERLHESSKRPAEGHFNEADASGGHHAED